MTIFSKKNILKMLLVLAVFMLTMPISYAVDTVGDNTTSTNPGSTVLPSTAQSVTSCENIMRYVDSHLEATTDVAPGEEGPPSVIYVESIKTQIAKKANDIDIPNPDIQPGTNTISYSDVLACAIKTGSVKMWMVPFFIRYILEFIIGLAGLIAVGGVVYGGYLYLFAGLSDDKDKGKNAIKNGIIGLVLVMTAWAIVNIVISLVTL